jgi:large subunit ribosomal protein L10
MPSSKVLEEKKQVVAALKERISQAACGVFVDYKGITVEQDTKLRAELRKAGVEYSVVKNTLTRLAIDDMGYSELESILNGTTALATSTEDLIAPAKVLAEFAKKNDKFTIKAGFVEGKVIDVTAVNALAALPSREGLLSMLLSALQGNLRGLACAIKAVAEKQDESTENN